MFEHMTLQHIQFIPKNSSLTRMKFLCPFLIQILSVRMKGIQNKKKKLISRKLIVIHVFGLCHGKGKFLNFLFHSRLMRMRQPVTFGELSKNVDTTGIGSMRVVASKIAFIYGCPVSFQKTILTSTSYSEMHLALGQQTADCR
jgi:hypothetical protein